MTWIDTIARKPKDYDSARFVGVVAMPVTKPIDGSTRPADVSSGKTPINR